MLHLTLDLIQSIFLFWISFNLTDRQNSQFLPLFFLSDFNELLIKQILTNNTYIFYYRIVVMNKRSLKSKRVHHEAKENILENGQTIVQPEHKRKTIKKAQIQLHVLQQSNRHKNPQQLRYLCQQQEKLVLAQYRSKRMFRHDEFYEHVKTQLAHSKICAKIMMIKAMSNEEAQEEMLRIQQIRGKYGAFSYNFSYPNAKEEEDEEQVKTVFKQCAKKTSMIEENDDVYLQDLGVDCLQIEQEQQNFEEDAEKQKYYPNPVTFSSYSQRQYYQNDDVFEF